MEKTSKSNSEIKNEPTEPKVGAPEKEGIDNKTILAFLILFGLTIFSMGMNGGIQSDWGNIDVRTVEIRDDNGRMLVGKLYRPKTALSSNPLPGVLAIHGYNNDKDVQRPHTLELAKRGIVVLAIDCLHQGDSDKGDFVFGGSSVPFEAYEWLEAQPFVDEDNTGVVGHSMGALFSFQVALAYPQIDVMGYQAFGPDNIAAAIPTFVNNQTNVIQICSSMEEFGSREWNQTREEWKEYCEQYIGINTQAASVDDGTTDFFKTYGSIASGTAQRYIWLEKTHPGQTHDLVATKEITKYFLQVLTGISASAADEQVQTTTYIWADIFGTLSALFLMLSIVPLLSLMLKTRIFKEVKQPMVKPKESLQTKNWIWWLFATVNMAIGGLVYVFFTAAPEWGQSWMYDARKIAEVTPAFDMAVANGFLMFYVVNAIINVVFVLLWYVLSGRKNGANLDDLGVYNTKKTPRENGRIMLKTIGLAVIIFLYMYAITYFGQWLWTIEIRGPWAMFKIFTEERAARFWLYYWGVLFFWIFNAGIWLFGLMRQVDTDRESKTVGIWWGKIVYAMLTGLVILNLIGYAPMWFGLTGPFLQIIPDGFAPMYLLQTWAFIPIAVVMFLIAIFYFRKTGKIWLGSILLAVLGTWLMVTGTVIDPYVLGG